MSSNCCLSDHHGFAWQLLPRTPAALLPGLCLCQEALVRRYVIHGSFEHDPTAFLGAVDSPMAQSCLLIFLCMVQAEAPRCRRQWALATLATAPHLQAQFL